MNINILQFLQLKFRIFFCNKEFYLFEKILQIYSNKRRELPLEFNKIVVDMCNVLLSVLFRLACHWNILIVIVNILRLQLQSVTCQTS